MRPELFNPGAGHSRWGTPRRRRPSVVSAQPMTTVRRKKARGQRATGTHGGRPATYTSATPTKEIPTRTKEQKRAYDAGYRDTHKDEIRACDAEYRDAHKDKIRAYRAAHKDKMCERAAMCQRWFTGNLRILSAAQGCDDCGTHESRLEHHHLDPASKTYSVSQMHKCLLEKFMDEVAKCTVLCRSCHLKRHAELRAA